MELYSDVQEELSEALSELQSFNQRHTLGNTLSETGKEHLMTAQNKLESAAEEAGDKKAKQELTQRANELNNAIETLQDHPSETDDIHLTSYDFIQMTIDWLEESTE